MGVIKLLMAENLKKVTDEYKNKHDMNEPMPTQIKDIFSLAHHIDKSMQLDVMKNNLV